MTDDKKECLRCGRVAEVGHKYGGGLICDECFHRMYDETPEDRARIAEALDCAPVRTAAYMRSKHCPPYTLDAILDHAESVAKTATCISGYWASRFTQSVLRELRDLGFTISGDGGDVVISWDTKQSQSERI